MVMAGSKKGVKRGRKHGGSSAGSSSGKRAKGEGSRKNVDKSAPRKEESVISRVVSSTLPRDDLERGKKDISLVKLLNYNLIFFIPMLVFIMFAMKIGGVYSDYFEASPGITAKIFMVPFMLVLFFFIIPFIREREKIAGIRYSILAFMIIGLGITLPSAFKGDISLILTIPTYFGSYVLLTFFFCPEVLGIERNLRDWFKHKKQFAIVFIYISIVMLYVVGFGALYFDIYRDPANPQAFEFAVDKEPSFATFVYYSMVSFTSTGYGEIIPVSTAARLVFFMEGTLALVMNVLFIAILLVFISNAEFLSQRKEERRFEREFEKEEKAIAKEEREIKDVQREVKSFEKKEGALMRFLKKLKPW